MNIAVLVSGSGSNLQALIDQLHRDTTCDIEISVVISDRNTAYALTRARQSKIPTHLVRLQDFQIEMRLMQRFHRLLTTTKQS